ncbi:hydroxymethylbilane synthase, partial [Nesterenkonia sp. PF2B19]|uniref:hydroxymethylbilane synthase n=1 Tax=Nesterenkonia sp. PF2B19 TaxID=1881858 RepID=UPI000A19C58E
MEQFRVGTRGSRLAMTQTTTVAQALSDSSGLGHELITVRTDGDILTGPLAQMGGTGVFASALRQALFDRTCDVAVHSLKDLPAKDLDGLSIAAVPVREDVRDALCSAGDAPLSALPDGAKVGTGSPRRAAQLLAARPDLQIVDIRGNVGTRLARVRGREEAGEVSTQAPDAARGDLYRRRARRRRPAPARVGAPHLRAAGPGVMLPAPGQGRSPWRSAPRRRRPAPLAMALQAYDDAAARLETTAERALLARLNAGCSAPIGGLARFSEDTDGPAVLQLRAWCAHRRLGRA